MPRGESESKLSDERIPHFTEVPEKPREPGPAGRIAQVRRFKDIAGIRQALCPSCLGSGFVHAERKQGLGVLYETAGHDKDGNERVRLIRCSCPLGQAKSKSKQLVESTGHEE